MTKYKTNGNPIIAKGKAKRKTLSTDIILLLQQAINNINKNSGTQIHIKAYEYKEMPVSIPDARKQIFFSVLIAIVKDKG